MATIPTRPRLPHAARLALATLVVAATTLGAQPEARAQGSGASRAERQRELRAEIHELSHEEERLLEALRASEAEIARLDAAVRELERRLAQTEARLREAEAAHARLLAEEQRVARRLARVRAELEAAEDLLVEQAIAAYVRGGSPTALNVLLSASDARAFHTAQTMVGAVLETQQRTIVRFTELEDEVDDLHGRARRASAEAARVRGEIASERAALLVERDAADGLRSRARAAAIAQESLLAQIEVRRQAYEAQLAALVQTSSSLGRELAAHQAGQQLSGALRGALAVPVSGARYSSEFGPRVHPIFGTVRMHTGADFAAPTGTPVVAAADGEVFLAEARGGYGLTVVIDHGGALATLYAHLSDFEVVAGQRIVRGHVIGYVGSTGNSTGPHLHLEVRVHGTPVDPIPYLARG